MACGSGIVAGLVAARGWAWVFLKGVRSGWLEIRLSMFDLCECAIG